VTPRIGTGKWQTFFYSVQGQASVVQVNIEGGVYSGE
jgi:hypothetical protein